MIASEEEESLSLCIEVAAPQKKAPVLKDTEIKTNADHQRLNIYFTIHSTYIQNLILRRQKPSIPLSVKSKFGGNCIIFKQFSADAKEAKRFYGEEGEIKGNICMILNPHINVEFRIWFSDNVKKSEDFIWMFFSFIDNGTWKTKSHTLEEDDKGSIFSCKIQIEQFKNYTEPNMLLTIAVKKKESSNTSQLGIVNLGNTCYMNSCLQMMFYLRPLRKVILDTKSDNKLIKELREVFIMLMQKEENKAIDAENFLESYEKYNQLPRRQQDVQEFLLDFINEIEMQCPEVKTLWEGKCSETTTSVEEGKYYRSVQNEEFAQLDVHLFDTKENPFERIQDSLQEMMKQEQVEDMIDHDEYGKIKVAKYRTFLNLPDVLFVNLKRYEWNKDKMKLSKIFSPIHYGENLNLGFIIGTPGNDQINPECDYTLFSVIVHKGTSPHNGHYFVFTNVSSNCEKPQWICFNDSIVTRSDPEEVLGFTGKKTKETILEKSIARFIEKEIESDASSYLIVYIRKQVFNQYQSIKTSIPKDYISEKIKKNAEKQQSSLEDVKILMIDELQNIDLFDDSLDLMSIPLLRSQKFFKEIKKISKQISGSQAKYFYRIYAQNKKVKRIEPYETVSDVITTRRGFAEVSYVLVLSDKIKLLSQILNIGNHDLQKIRQKSILHISRNDLTDLALPDYCLASPKDFDELQKIVDQKNGQIICMSELKDFQRYWNRYLEVEIYKNY